MNNLRIMIVDDEEAIRESLAAWLEKGGDEVAKASSANEALEMLSGREYDLVLLDIKMPGMDGHELLRQLHRDYPSVIVVMITAYASIESAVTAMKEGAADYLLKPFDPEQLMLLIQKMASYKKMLDECRVVRARLSELESSVFDDLIGGSEAMKKVFAMIEDVAGTEAPVLITGETGTGKELVARAIHTRSPRRQGPFIAINCGALPEHLLESELFGHERGAFTGAVKTRLGRLEMADRGTLFLDEVGEVSMQMQVNLLRVLEEKKLIRVGGSREVVTDFRLICATHRNMEALVAQGLVRSDFYYRINVISINVPPLRERGDDIGLLANHFILMFSREMSKYIEGLTLGAYKMLDMYDWPGNVRELRNVMERAVVVSRGGKVDARDLTFLSSGKVASAPGSSLKEVEKNHIGKTLDECGGVISRAAEMLGVNRGTLARKMKKHGLSRA
ncbi:MAG: sigma-54 dependent transcriptional regulator [Pseudomonadota bacterium]